MKVVAVYGAQHKGSTYNIAKLLLKKLNVDENEVTEVFLPKDMPHFCTGCTQCFMSSEEKCPHRGFVAPIHSAIEKADLLVFATPVYVFHATGQMKTFLDHFGFQWMVHRPNETMFSKMAFVVSTAAGGGMKPAIKDITDSLNFWGVGRIFTYGKAVFATNWSSVSEKRKCTIEKDIGRIAGKILDNCGKVKPSMNVKSKFFMYRLMQKKIMKNPPDLKYWEEKGWLESKRPW